MSELDSILRQIKQSRLATIGMYRAYISQLDKDDVDEAEAELAQLQKIKQAATEFEIMPQKRLDDGRAIGEIRIKRRGQRDGSMKWAVYMRDSWVLTKDFEWALEPIPSSRTDEFLATTRFDTLDEAWSAAEKSAAALEAE